MLIYAFFGEYFDGHFVTRTSRPLSRQTEKLSRGYFPRAVFFFGFGFLVLPVLPVLPGAASFFGASFCGASFRATAGRAGFTARPRGSGSSRRAGGPRGR